MTILIVDDDFGLLRLLRRELGTAGHDAVIASDGEGALSVACKLRPDVAIIDIRLGHEDGLALVAALRDAVPSLVTIVASSLPGAEARDLAAGTEADYFWSKSEPRAIHRLLAAAARRTRRQSEKGFRR